jgi:chromosome segregation ATPase
MPRSRFPQNEDKLHQRTQWGPQEHPERRNAASNQKEAYRDDTGYGQQNVQETLKKFQDHKNRDFEKAKEQTKETMEELYKHQSETKNMRKKINELRTKINNIKEKETQDMENLRKKNKTEMQNNKMEGQSSRIE